MPIYKFSDIVINSTAKKQPVDSDKNVYIGLEHLSPDTFLVEKYGADMAPKGEKLIMKKGDVLFGKRRAYQKKVGIAPCDGIFSAHGMVLRPKEDIVDKDFFPFFIKSDYFLDKAIEISVGSLSPTINWGDLKELEFYLPSLEKQKELSEILWSLERTKEQYRQLISATRNYIKIVFKNVKNSNPVLLGSICRPKQWKTIGTKEFTETGYPVYGANGIIGYYKNYNHENETILIGCRGTCGVVHVCKKKSYINGNAMCLDNLSNNVDLKFLETYLKYYDFSSIITGSSQPQIIASTLNEVKINLPDYETQLLTIKEISKYEEIINHAVDNLKKLHSAQKKFLFECFKDND